MGGCYVCIYGIENKNDLFASGQSLHIPSKASSFPMLSSRGAILIHPMSEFFSKGPDRRSTVEYQVQDRPLKAVKKRTVKAAQLESPSIRQSGRRSRYHPILPQMLLAHANHPCLSTDPSPGPPRSPWPSPLAVNRLSTQLPHAQVNRFCPRLKQVHVQVNRSSRGPDALSQSREQSTDSPSLTLSRGPSPRIDTPCLRLMLPDPASHILPSP